MKKPFTQVLTCILTAFYSFFFITPSFALSPTDSIPSAEPEGHRTCFLDHTINCEDQTATLSAFITEIGGGSTPITVDWSTGENAHSIVVTPAGGWTFNANGFDCDHFENSLTLGPFFTGNLEILGPPAFCPGMPVDLTVTTDGYDFTNFQWSPNIFDDLTPVTINGPGNFTINVVDELGCPFSANLVVPPSPPILPMLTGPNILCTENDTGFISVSPNFMAYQWPDGETTNPVMVTAPGFYEVTVTNQFGCTGTGVTGVQNGDIELFSILSDEPDLCPGESTDLTLNGPFIGYVWSTGQSAFVITVDEPGTYTVTVTNIHGCTGTNSVTIDPTPIPDIEIVGPPICPGDSAILSVSGGTFMNYLWSSGDTTATITVADPGDYSVLVTADSICPAMDTITVVNTNPPNAEIAAPPPIDCANSVITLDGSGSDNSPDIGISWTTSDGNITSGGMTLMPMVDQGGTYILEVYDSTTTCVAYDTVTVTVDQLPPGADAGVQQLLDCINTTAVLGPGVPPTDTTLTYVWTTSDGNITSGDDTYNPSIDAPGTYTVVVTNPANGCTSTDSVVVTEDVAVPMAAIANPDTITCVVNNVVLDASGSTGSNLNFMWSTMDGSILSGGNTAMPTVSQEGTYTVVVTNGDNGCTSTAMVEVIQDANIPMANAADPDTLTCTTTQLTLDGAGSSTGSNITYSWSTVDGNIVSGSTSLTPTIDQPGNYTLMVFNTDNNCTSNFNVTVEQDIMPPVADAGPDPTLNCTSPSLMLDGSGSSSGSNFTYQWTTADGNILSGATGLMPTIDMTGTYNLLVTNLDNGCTSTASTTVQQDANAPTVAIAAPDELNCLTLSVILDAGTSSQGADFDIVWNGVPGGIINGANGLQPEVNLPGQYTLVITNTTNGCVDSTSITVNQDIATPSPDAGPDGLINCTNPVINIGSTNNPTGANFDLQWTTSNGNIVSGANTDQPTIDQSGEYILEITNTDNGCVALDTASVLADFVPPTADAGPGFQLDCQQTSYILQGVAGQGNNLDLVWSTPDGNIVSGGTSANPEVNAAGNYTLLVTNLDNGCTADASVTITQSADVPVAVAGQPQTLTCATTQVQLNGLGSSAGNGITYTWTTADGNIVSGTNNIDPTVDAPGTYVIEVFDTNNSCSAFSSVVIPQDIENPVIDAGPNNTLTCTTLSLGLQAIVSSSSSPNLVYQWDTPDGNIFSGANTAMPTIDAAGTYSVTVTDQNNGCTATDQLLIVNDVASPVSAIQAPGILTCTTLNLQLDGTASSQGADFSFVWSTVGGQFVGQPNSLQPTIDEPGTYTLLITNTVNGCTETMSVEVTEDVNLPTAEAGITDELTCATTSLDLDGNGSSTGGNFQYTWTTTDGQIDLGINTLTPTVSAPGTYEILVLNTDNGCTQTDVVTITEDIQEPVLSIGQPDELDCITSAIILTGAATSAGNNPTVTWTSSNGNILSGASTLMPTVNAAGTYNLLVENTQNGCTSTTQVQVSEDVTPPVVSIQNPDLLTCTVTEIILEGSSSPGTTLSWTTLDGNILTGNSGLTPTVNSTGTYSLLATNTGNGCTASTDIVVLQENNIPTGFDFALTPPSCLGTLGLVSIDQIQGGIGPFMYSIDGGQTFQTEEAFDGLDPGNYTMVIQDINGCEVDDMVSIPAPPEPGVDLPPSFIIELGASQQLQPIIPASFPLNTIDSVAWEPLNDLTFSGSTIQQQLTPTASPIGYTEYTLTLFTAEGCSATARTQIWVKDDVSIYAPNVIKPDDPTHPENARFTLYAGDLGIDRILTLQIYDRWGAHVFQNQDFEPNNPNLGWDGTYLGDDMTPAVFVWWAEVLLINGDKLLLKGDVSVVR